MFQEGYEGEFWWEEDKVTKEKIKWMVKANNDLDELWKSKVENRQEWLAMVKVSKSD